MAKEQKWNVIFLLDNFPPLKILLLKRSQFKSFAPGLYSGVGGKVEEGETIDESAYRELKEETGVGNVKLHEFARSKVGEQTLLYFFAGRYRGRLGDCPEGELEWVVSDRMLEKDLIPSTYFICKEWIKRGFSLENPFTLFEKIIKIESGVAQVEVERIVDGFV